MIAVLSFDTLVLMVVEGEEAEGPSKKWELLSEKVPETSRSKTES